MESTSKKPSSTAAPSPRFAFAQSIVGASKSAADGGANAGSSPSDVLNDDDDDDDDDADPAGAESSPSSPKL
eukprot:21948-Pelagococcus_subviridis.AAC.1